MSWYNFTSAISKPLGIFLEWADVISVSEWEWEWVSEWVSEWDTHVFIRKRTVVIGIFTNFKWQNSGEVKDVTIRGGGQFFRGRLGSWRTLWKLYFSKFTVFMTVSHKSKPVKLLCVRLESDFILFSFRQIKK